LITTKIDGELYRTMLLSAAASLEAKKEEVNNLNVFPVPDGDTGTNMCLTIEAVRSPALMPNQSLSLYSEAAAKAMMRAARGNSGVILSLFFRGMAKAFAGNETADCELLTKAFRQGAEEARKAVQNPVEGTILTVMRECCSDDRKSETQDAAQLLEGFLYMAKETLKKTPEMLPALKRARVVDSGGCGFVAIVDGMKRALTGEAETDLSFGDGFSMRSAADFDEFTEEEIRFAYCTECLLAKKNGLPEAAVSELSPFLASIGDSAVITDDDEIIKIHVHTNEPLTVLTRLVHMGDILFSKIENMKQQHKALSSEKETDTPKKPYGIFAVTNGEGLGDVFKELGADRIIAGGQCMNPSADDFLKAIKSLPCEKAILLPNNPNIILAAQQAAELAEDVQVEVVRSVTVPQGISAMLSFDGNLSLDDNIANMSAALKGVTTLSVAKAAKDATANDLFVKKKQYIGLVDNSLRYAADTLEDCLKALAGEIKDKEIITVYYGKGVKEGDARHAADVIGEVLGQGCEIITVRGMQPIYSFIISAE